MKGECEKHALQRLRERYFPEASKDDLAEIKNLARSASRKVAGAPFTDTKRVFVIYKSRFVDVVFVPRHDAIRTFLPCSAMVRPGKSA